MKTLGAAILGLSLLSLLITAEAFLADRETLVKANGLMGSPVRSTEGRHIGRIKELFINPEGGEIAYAVVAGGVLLGLGGEAVAIPWDAFEVARDKDQTIVLTVNIPVFEIDELE